MGQFPTHPTDTFRGGVCRVLVCSRFASTSLASARLCFQKVVVSYNLTVVGSGIIHSKSSCKVYILVDFDERGTTESIASGGCCPRLTVLAVSVAESSYPMATLEFYACSLPEFPLHAFGVDDPSEEIMIQF